MVVLRIITPNLFPLFKKECPFELVNTKFNSPILTFDKHTQRFIQVESSGSKEAELPPYQRPLTKLPPRGESHAEDTRVQSSVLSTYPPFCTAVRSLSSLDCCSIVKFPRCLNGSAPYYFGTLPGSPIGICCASDGMSCALVH